MSNELYQKEIDKIQELTNSPDSDSTGFIDIGEALKDIAPDLKNYVVDYTSGGISSRPRLINKQKVLTTITTLVAKSKPQIGMHVKTGLSVGLAPEESVGCIMHMIPYVGFPSVIGALTATKEVFAEEGVTVDTSDVE